MVGELMLNGINEGLSDDWYKVKVKNHSGDWKTFVTLSNLKYAKNQI